MKMKQLCNKIGKFSLIAIFRKAIILVHRYGTSKDYNRFSKEYIKLYDGIIKTAIIQNDESHPWLYSSPSNGRSKYNESIIIQNDPQDWHYGDSKFNGLEHTKKPITFKFFFFFI